MSGEEWTGEKRRKREREGEEVDSEREGGREGETLLNLTDIFTHKHANLITG